MTGNVIEVSDLTKTFGELKAVDHVSFEVQEGEIFGFLGPNGAGKTTTINMLTTVQRPSAGQAKVAGHDIAHDALGVRRSIGLVPQEYTADEDLTGIENLLLVARLYDIPKPEARKRADELLTLVQLKDAADRTVETYSGGMRRRLELACGLINRPKVLFLDEPTLGLDVQTRAAVWQYIRLLKEQYHMTLFMTTHYLEEADNLCDRIAIIDHGKIVALDTPATLKASLGGDIVEIQVNGVPTGDLEQAVRGIPSVREVKPSNGGYRLTVINGEETAPLILDAIRGLNLKLSRISIAKPTLDEVYLDRTGRSMREMEGSREDVFRQRITMRRARP
ncbi:MAG TPA: ATP-binding cassette domain-containing protein [Thermoplasmata archaeon]|nr:ATP-binding cassette domain-containing protein [Thermoplasmata archaeon]